MARPLTLDGVRRSYSDPVFDRPLPAPGPPAPLARGVAERRADVAARRRLCQAWDPDDPAERAERAGLLARLSRPI